VKPLFLYSAGPLLLFFLDLSKPTPLSLISKYDLFAFVCHEKVHDGSLGIFENIVELFLHDPVNTEF
jgi:hypothetical protein